MDTPMLPPTPVSAGKHCGLLTVLTGVEAGGAWVIGPYGLVVGRAQSANVVVDSSSVSRHHARFGQGPNGTYFVEDLKSTNGTFIGFHRVEWAPLSCGDLVRLGPDFRLRFSLADESEVCVRRQTYEAAVRDPLSGLYNRRYLMQRLAAEVEQAQRTGGDVALLMIDVDDLKRLNDRLGHLAGDRALCALARSIVDGIRAEDLAARYGGDEFAVLAPCTSRAEATILAERIRHTSARRQLAAGGSLVTMSSSIGVASWSELGSHEAAAVDLIALADARLYEAKRSRSEAKAAKPARSTWPPGATVSADETTEIRMRAIPLAARKTKC